MIWFWWAKADTTALRVLSDPADFAPVSLLTHPTTCWDYRSVAPYLVSHLLLIEIGLDFHLPLWFLSIYISFHIYLFLFFCSLHSVAIFW